MFKTSSLHKGTGLTGLMFGLVLGLMLLCLPLPLQAAALQKTDEEALLQEISQQIEKYYLFAPEEGVKLQSLDELPLLWQDPHSTYLQPEQFSSFTESLGRSLTGIGVYLEKGEMAVTVVSPVPGSPAYRAGIKSGDLIYAVDGQKVLHFPLEKVVALLRGKEGTTVMVTVLRGEQFHSFSLMREQIHLPNLEHILLEDELALVRIYNFDSGVAREMSLLLEGLEEEGIKGIILDLRANHGGYVEEALTLAALFTDGTLLQVREKGMEWKKTESPHSAVTSLPLVVLINSGTASGAEIVAAALKDNGAALLLGDNTFGKGTMQTVMPLRHGGYLKVTTAEFASPRQTTIEGTGVEPHFFVPEPLEQEDTAVLLLSNVLKQEQDRPNYLELFLQHDEEASAPALSVAERHLEEPFYPLRALLTMTGRPILKEPEREVYIFSWEGSSYRLDLPQRILSRTGSSLDANYNVLLHHGTTYVPLSFLTEELGLPFLD